MATRKKAKRVTKKEVEQKQRVKFTIYSSILAAFAILILFATFVSGEGVWEWFHNFLFGVFGFSTYFVGPIMLYIAVLLALVKPVRQINIRLFQMIALVLVVDGLIQILFLGAFDGNSIYEVMKNLFQQGTEVRGGGVASMVLGWPLFELMGKTGASIILFILLLLFVLLVSRKSIVDIYNYFAAGAKKVKEKQAEKKKEQEELEKKSRTQIIVDDLSAPGDKKDVIDIGLDEEEERAREKFKPENRVPEVLNAEVKTEVPEISELSKEIHAKEIHDDLKEIKKEREPKFSVQENDQVMFFDGSSSDYAPPPVSLLNQVSPSPRSDGEKVEQENAVRLVETLESFGVHTKIVDVSRGPAVTRYELQPSAGVKISRITSLADDIALNLAASGVRIEAPIPGKAAVGIEVPNRDISTVSIRELLQSDAFLGSKSPLTVALGRDISGDAIVADLAKMPHLLIAGSTGSGKSVCINTLILSLVYKASPDDVKLVLVDPKMVELGVYNGLPHLMVPVVTDPKKAAGALGWAVSEMLKRYKDFAEHNVRDLAGFNKLAKKNPELEKKPQVVIIIDELSDLMMAAPGEVEDSICRLAQMARAAGMHLVIATQRPSVDVITGTIKSNIPSRIAFAVSSQIDSRVILDGSGAEKLMGRGDMLFFPVGASKPSRIQCCYVSDAEVERVVKYFQQFAKNSYDDEVLEEIDKHVPTGKKGKSAESSGSGTNMSDELFPRAVEVVIEAGLASTSLLQRRLKLGYARAARIIDEMEEKGMIGPYEGSKPRQVIITKNQWSEMQMRAEEPSGENSESDE